MDVLEHRVSKLEHTEQPSQAGGSNPSPTPPVLHSQVYLWGDLWCIADHVESGKVFAASFYLPRSGHSEELRGLFGLSKALGKPP